MTRWWVTVIGATLAVVAWMAPTAPARADGQTDGPAGPVTLFDARAVGAVVDFNFFAPQAVFPFPFQGGVLESTSVATSSPRGFGFAGFAPVPAATSIGILVPQKDPFTGGDVPPNVQDAFKSVDYTQLPTGCQALFPPVEEGGDEVNCGGPNQDDPALAFTYAGFNGYSRATGNLDDPLATKTLSRSRAEDIGLPSLQATIRQAWTQAVTGVNDRGLPQADSFAAIDSIKLAGSLVKIEGLSSHTIVATDGTQAGTAAQTSLTVRAASVAGIPVLIGPDGISVDQNQVPQSSLQPLSKQVADALANAGGLTVRLLGAPSPRMQGNEVTAESASLQISYDNETPTPVQVAYRIGFTKGVVNALPSLDGDDLSVPPTLPAVPAEESPASAEATSSPVATADSTSTDLGLELGGAGPAAATITAGLSGDDAAAGAAFGAVARGSNGGYAAGIGATGPTGESASTSGAAVSRGALGDQQLLVPAVGMHTLPSTGLRRLYGGMFLAALGAGALARLPRLSWLQPRRVPGR